MRRITKGQGSAHTRRGKGPTVHFRFDKKEHPEVTALLECKNRAEVREKYGIHISDEEEWPARDGAYKGRVLALLATIAWRRKEEGEWSYEGSKNRRESALGSGGEFNSNQLRDKQLDS